MSLYPLYFCLERYFNVITVILPYGCLRRRVLRSLKEVDLRPVPSPTVHSFRILSTTSRSCPKTSYLSSNGSSMSTLFVRFSSRQVSDRGGLKVRQSFVAHEPITTNPLSLHPQSLGPLLWPFHPFPSFTSRDTGTFPWTWNVTSVTERWLLVVPDSVKNLRTVLFLLRDRTRRD